MTPTPHDAIFKSTFSNPTRAMQLVKAVFPRRVTQHLDLASAKLMPGRFVNDALSEKHSDLLFHLSIDGGEAFAYLLFEHQSKVDRLMPYRMLLYMVGIWERWKDENANATRLPVIFPVVLSHAQAGWTAAPGFSSLYELKPRTLKDLRPWLLD